MLHFVTSYIKQNKHSQVHCVKWKSLLNVLNTYHHKPGLSLRAKTCNTCYGSVLDFPSMLQVTLPVVDRIHPQSNNFVMGVKINTTGDSKLNDRPFKL